MHKYYRNPVPKTQGNDILVEPAPAGQQILSSMHYATDNILALRNKGYYELMTEAQNAEITIQELIQQYRKGQR